MALPKKPQTPVQRVPKPAGTTPSVRPTGTPSALKGNTNMGGRSGNYNRFASGTKGINKPGKA